MQRKIKGAKKVAAKTARKVGKKDKAIKPANPYKIDKGVKIHDPIAGQSSGQPSRVTATLQLLEKGDSFGIADALEAMKASKIVRDFNARQRTSTQPRKFVTRKYREGIRVWRTE
jgi:hypothetical protein